MVDRALGPAEIRYLANKAANSGVEVTGGMELTLRDPANVDSAVFSLDGVDMNTVFTGVLDWNITGLPASSEIFITTAGVKHEISLVQLKHKATNTDRDSTTTLADDGELAGIELEADTFYSLEAILVVDAASAVPDFKYTFSFSQAAQDSHTTHNAIDDVGSADNGSELATATVSIALSASDVMVIHIFGFIHSNATTGGTIALQWAQDTSNATPTTLHAGSWVRLTRMVQ